MAVLLPEIDCYLDTSTAELNLHSMAHSDVLGIKHNKWLLLHLNRHVI